MSKFCSLIFNEKFSGALETLSLNWPYSAGIRSRWADNSRYSTNVSKNYWEALQGFLGCNSSICYGEAADGTIVVERTAPKSGAIEIIMLKPNGELKGAIVDPATSSWERYELADKSAGTPGCKGTALTCAFINRQMSDSEAADLLASDVNHLLNMGENDVLNQAQQNELSQLIAALGDNFYRRTIGAHIIGTPMLNDYPSDNSDIERLSQTDLNSIKVLSPKGAKPIYMAVEAPLPKIEPATTPRRAARGSKAKNTRPSIDLSLFGENVYTPESGLEKATVPVWHQWREHETDLAQRIADSFAYDAPMQVVGFFGPAGCGKTETATAIADLLGLSKVIASCGPDTDSDYFWGAYRPKVGANGVEYEFVEGPLTKALRYGCLLEIQEVGLIRRAGVVAELNDVLEAGIGKSFVLPTGERVPKSSHFVAVFTSNDGYEGTQILNQSVLSRMNEVLYFENPTAETMAARTKAVVTDWSDDDELRRMAGCIVSIADACHKKGIEDGVCGQRELTNWAIACRLLMKRRGEVKLTNAIIREAAQSAVLNKASQNREEIISLGFETLNKHYGDFAATVVG